MLVTGISGITAICATAAAGAAAEPTSVILFRIQYVDARSNSTYAVMYNDYPAQYVPDEAQALLMSSFRIQ